jgi:hypothetical protein
MKAVWVLVYIINSDYRYEVFKTRKQARKYRDEMRVSHYQDETFVKIEKSWLHA